MFAQVLRAVEDLGEQAVAERLRAALASGEPMALAMRRQPVVATASLDALPTRLSGVQILAARAADYDVLLGGDV